MHAEILPAHGDAPFCCYPLQERRGKAIEKKGDTGGRGKIGSCMLDSLPVHEPALYVCCMPLHAMHAALSPCRH